MSYRMHITIETERDPDDIEADEARLEQEGVHLPVATYSPLLLVHVEAESLYDLTAFAKATHKTLAAWE